MVELRCFTAIELAEIDRVWGVGSTLAHHLEAVLIHEGPPTLAAVACPVTQLFHVLVDRVFGMERLGAGLA